MSIGLCLPRFRKISWIIRIRSGMLRVSSSYNSSKCYLLFIFLPSSFLASSSQRYTFIGEKIENYWDPHSSFIRRKPKLLLSRIYSNSTSWFYPMFTTQVSSIEIQSLVTQFMQDRSPFVGILTCSNYICFQDGGNNRKDPLFTWEWFRRTTVSCRSHLQ